MQLPLLVFRFSLTLVPFTNPTNTAKPGCQAKCGNVTVPYPFGIGPDEYCFINPWFEITCNTSFHPPKPFYGSREIYDISNSSFRMSNKVASRCFDQYGNVTHSVTGYTNMRTGSPFTFSEQNKFTLIGCGDFAVFTDPDRYSTGCLSVCSSAEDVDKGSCMGGGCCQVSVQKGQTFYVSVTLGNPNSQSRSAIWSFNPCTYSFIGEQERFTFRGASDLIDPDFGNRIRASVPILMDWVIGNLSCSEAHKTGRLACKENSYCIDSDTGIPGYRCVCSKGYEGNPYLDPGCQDIDECQDPSMNSCEQICSNFPGYYTCSCLDGYFGDGLKNGSGCIVKTSHFPVIKFSLGMGFGFLATLVGLTWLYLSIKKRNLVKLRQDLFQKNGGLLLQQRLLNNPSSIDSTVVFTAKDLEIAINYTAKIADFGASRLIPVDQKQVKTMVQGTFGYLDPEYFNTGQLNEKSDVYSFGVVLAELLTGKKPVLQNRTEYMNLAKVFVTALEEDRLFQILERRVVREGPIAQLQEISELVKRCLNLSGDDRPTMKTVEIQLEGLRKFTQHPWAISHDETQNLTSTQVDLYSCT